MASGPHWPVPASLEPSSGCALSWAAVPWPTGAQAHSGWSCVGLRLRVEVHRAHPQPELHRRDRLPHRLEARVGEARCELRARGPVPARLRVLRGVGLPVARARLPAVVEDERVDAEPARDRGDLADGGDVHVVLGAGRDHVGVGAVRVEGDVVGVGHEPVAREVAVELPGLVAVAVAEAGERGLQPQRLPRFHHARAPDLRIRGVLDVALLLEGPEADHVAAEVRDQPGVGAVVCHAGRRLVVSLHHQEGRAGAVGERDPLRRALYRLARRGRARLAPGAGVRVADLDLRAGPVGLTPVRAGPQGVDGRPGAEGGRLLERGAGHHKRDAAAHEGLGAEAGDAGIGLHRTLDLQAGHRGASGTWLEEQLHPQAAAGEWPDGGVGDRERCALQLGPAGDGEREVGATRAPRLTARTAVAEGERAEREAVEAPPRLRVAELHDGRGHLGADVPVALLVRAGGRRRQRRRDTGRRERGRKSPPCHGHSSRLGG